MQFPRSVAAARGVGMEKKVLAEALLAEIPPRGRGPQRAGVTPIRDLFTQAAAEILAETGESYAAKTLEHYRNVAAWVSGESSGTGTLAWADASWTAHREAFEKKLTWKEFSQGKRTKRAVRQQSGAASGDVPAAARAINEAPAEARKFVEQLDDKGMEAVAEAALSRELTKSGIPHHERRPPGNPEPRWYQLSRRIELDLIEIHGAVNQLRAEGNTAEAQQAITRMREVLAKGVSDFEDIPDTIEGLTK